jgi:GAF domain-containing protein
MSSEHDPRPLQPSGVRDAFAELGRVSFADTSMDALLDRIAALAKRVIPGVADASVSLVLHDKATTAAFTGRLALALDESQYDRGHGPCLDAALGQEVQRIPDTREQSPWPGYARECVELGALSTLSVPVPVGETVHGALNLYATEPHAFDAEAADVATEFASYVAVALQNMRLYETTRELAQNLDTAMRSRAVIEQAKGILMSQRRCDSAEAFTLLAAASQRANRKVRDIAQAIVDGVHRTSGDDAANN